MSGDLTPQEVAALLRVSKNTVYELVKRGELKAYTVGNKFRFDVRDVEAFKSRKHSVGEPKASSTREGDEGFVLCGQDMVLDLIGQKMESGVPGLRVYRSSLGSYNGLHALYMGEADAASCHLWDGDSNRYNIPYLRHLVPGTPIAVLHIARRTVGFYVPRGNPLNLVSWEDLRRPTLRLANREKGSGIRVLLDERARILGLAAGGSGRGTRAGTGAGRETLLHDAAPREYPGHVEVALTVARGEADFGVGSRKAASQVEGVDFVPLQQEDYDLVFRHAEMDRPAWKALVSIVQSDAFRAELLGLGDYDATSTGRLSFL